MPLSGSLLAVSEQGRAQLAKLGLVVAIGMFWGGNWPAVRLSLEEIPPITLRAIGFTVGALVLLGWARLRGLHLRVPVSERPWLVVVGLLSILGFNLCTAFGQLLMPTSQAVIIAFTMPLWATLLSIPVLGERVLLQQWLGLALGFAGLLLLLGPAAAGTAGTGLLGPFLVLIAALSWAGGTVLIKRRGNWLSHVVVITGWQYVACAVPMIVLAVLLEQPHAPTRWSLSTALGLAYHLVFAVCLAQMLWFVMVRRLTVGQATIATFLIPVIGVASSIVVLAEPLSARLVVALLFTLGAVGCVMIGRRQSTAAPPAAQESRSGSG